MKLLLLIHFTVFSILFTSAQNRKIDSLNTELTKAKTDTAIINLLNAKAFVYSRNSLDSTIKLTDITKEKAKQANYLKGEAEAYRLAAMAYTYKGAFEPAMVNLKKAEQLFKQGDNNKALMLTYDGFGMYYGMQSKYDSSIVFYKKAIDYYEKNNYNKELAASYQNIAIDYTMLSNYTQALNYQSKALHLSEILKDTTNMAFINVNMAITYNNLHDFVRSEALLLKGIEYAKQKQLNNVELYGYANLASTYKELKRFKESYEYAMKAEALGKQLGDYAIVASALARAGEALAYQRQYKQAEQLGAQAIATADTTGSPMNIFQTLVSMGLIKKLQEQYPVAIWYYEKGFAALKDADLYDEQIGTAYNDLSQLYEQEGLYQKALTAFRTATKISDSIRSRENIRNATELSMNYEFAKKEHAIKAEQEKKNAIANVRQLALLTGLGFTILIIIGALVAYRHKQKANVALQHQKERLEKTLAELKATQDQLIHSEKMASLGELTAGIAHEIQNPLNFVNNFSEVSQELLDEMEEEIQAGNTEIAKSISTEVKQNLQKIVHHGRRADLIVKGMLQHSRKSTGQKEPVNINVLAEEYLRLSYSGFRVKDKSFNATLQTSFDSSVGKINIIPQDIGRALLNLYTNAMYAVQQKQKRLNGNDYEPSVFVSTKKVDSNIEIKVRDNGDGIPEKIAAKIFQPFFTTKPTGAGTGLGLSLSYDIITKGHNGSLTIHSQEGEYAEFIITLPA
jgi:two-component system NtrC family sensor kinase